MDSKVDTLPLCQRCIRTFLLYTGFLSLGMCFSVVGPTLQDLAFVLGTDTANMSTIYTARSSGLILGCLIGGLLLERFHRVRVVGIAYCMSGIFTGLLPWCNSLWLLIAVMLVNGISMGMVDTGSSVWCLDLWPVRPGPFMHALHFAFGIGTFIAPLIAEPFLIPQEITNPAHLELGVNDTDSIEAELLRANFTTAEIDELRKIDGLYEEISYGIIGTIMTAIGVATLILTVLNPEDPKRRDLVAQNQPDQADQQRDEVQQSSPRYRSLLVAVIVAMVLLHFLVYGGIEIAYGQLVATYVVKRLPEAKRWNKSNASFLTSAFWGAFMTGRGASIFINHCVKNFTLIVVDHVIIVVSCFALAFFAENSDAVLWIATATFGLGMSAVYPAIYGWVGTKIHVSNRIGGFFAIGTAAGEMLIPFVVGQFLEANPPVLMYSAALCSVLMVVLAMVLIFCVRKLTSMNRKAIK